MRRKGALLKSGVRKTRFLPSQPYAPSPSHRGIFTFSFCSHLPESSRLFISTAPGRPLSKICERAFRSPRNTALGICLVSGWGVLEVEFLGRGLGTLLSFFLTSAVGSGCRGSPALEGRSPSFERRRLPRERRECTRRLDLCVPRVKRPAVSRATKLQPIF